MTTHEQAYLIHSPSGRVYAVQYRDNEIVLATSVDDYREITDEALDGWIGNIAGDDNDAEYLNSLPDGSLRLYDKRYIDGDLLTPAEAGA